jgi:hypothetical protein
VKRYAPAAARNRQPIASALAEELPLAGVVLEVASGTGEHAVHFARLFPALEWYPSDPDAAARASIDAWRAEAGLPNLHPALALDAAAEDWPLSTADAVVCINMVHISPPASAEGLLAGAARLLPKGAPLVLYGPWLEAQVEPAPSNLAFDSDLRSRNRLWGLRRREWFDDRARGAGFEPSRRIEMPANNLLLVYRRAGRPNP